ncbi:hypothetical protein AVEN_59689-1 [Araneus ventricosus]|uniref:Uncharacterized protein n=1 Tax=Araneus ventricosus TaxID=182803 RepID=A0A4Y2BMR8_ARAVE|nr:hypothetical protein AVEN_59689-1 [Araneus ventricosus]
MECVKWVIHRWYVLEFLEHGKKKPIVKVENLLNLEQMEWKWWNSNELKIQNSIRRFNLDERVAVKQRVCLHLDLASRLEMKLEIPRVGEEVMGGKNFATLNLVSEQTFERP